MSKKLTYDSAYKELQQILTTIQSDETGLDQLSEMLVRAKELAEFCKSKLREIEEDLNKLNPTE